MYNRRDNNNILNPQGAPNSNDGFGTGYKPERGGYARFGQNQKSEMSSIIYGGSPHDQPVNYKPSVQLGDGSQQQSQFKIAHDALTNNQPMSNQQFNALSDIQQRIIQQNRQVDERKGNISMNQQHQADDQGASHDAPRHNRAGMGMNQSQQKQEQRDLSEDRRRQNAIKQGGEAILMSGQNRKSLNGPPTQPLQEQRNDKQSESIHNLAPKDVRNSYELEPVENYKGKSLEELEAILDAHNKSRESAPTKPQSREVASKPRISSAIRANKKDAEIKEPRFNSQKRQSELRNPKAGAKQVGSKQGPRAPIPKAQNKNKENQIEVEKKKGYGQVPKYLQRFNKQKDEANAQKALEQENSKAPPGTRKMPESERQEMLLELKSTKVSIESEIQKFPMSMKTIAIQKRKTEMEEQLNKVEKSISLFSREIVYVGI